MYIIVSVYLLVLCKVVLFCVKICLVNFVSTVTQRNTINEESSKLLQLLLKDIQCTINKITSR